MTLPIIKDLKNAEQLVAYVLREFPETRGDDRTLFLKAWDLQGFRLPKKLIPLFYKVHLPETLRRARQEIQAGGLYKADPLKTAERSLFAMEHRQYHRENK